MKQWHPSGAVEQVRLLRPCLMHNMLAMMGALGFTRTTAKRRPMQNSGSPAHRAVRVRNLSCICYQFLYLSL
jgi:hypothetical protein